MQQNNFRDAAEKNRNAAIKIINKAINCRGCNNRKKVMQKLIVGDAAVKNR